MADYGVSEALPELSGAELQKVVTFIREEMGAKNQRHLAAIKESDFTENKILSKVQARILIEFWKTRAVPSKAALNQQGIHQHIDGNAGTVMAAGRNIINNKAEKMHNIAEVKDMQTGGERQAFHMHGGKIEGQNQILGANNKMNARATYHAAASTSESPSALSEQVSSFSEDYDFRKDLNFRPENVAKLVPDHVDQETYDNHFGDDEIYAIPHPEKKQALILNILKNREGAQEDTKNLKAQLPAYGFKDPVVKENFTEQEMWQEIDDFLTSKKVMEAPVVLLYIGSHGCRKNNLDYFLDVNGKLISIREVIKTFALPKHKRALAGKPKLFLLSFCRDEEKNAEVQADSITGQSQEEYNPSNLIDWFNEVRQIATDSDGNAFNWKDMCLGFSTIPGAVSYRYGGYGTWFVIAICAVFRKSAWKDDWISLLTKVNQAVVKRGDENGVNALCVFRSMLMKKLFLFPQ